MQPVPEEDEVWEFRLRVRTDAVAAAVERASAELASPSTVFLANAGPSSPAVLYGARLTRPASLFIHGAPADPQRSVAHAGTGSCSARLSVIVHPCDACASGGASTWVKLGAAGAGTDGSVGGSLERPVSLTPLVRQSPPGAEPDPAAAPTLVWQPVKLVMGEPLLISEVAGDGKRLATPDLAAHQLGPICYEAHSDASAGQLLHSRQAADAVAHCAGASGRARVRAAGQQHSGGRLGGAAARHPHAAAGPCCTSCSLQSKARGAHAAVLPAGARLAGRDRIHAT